MDDLTLRYYDAEMRYLLEVGEEFARAHPEHLLVWRDAESFLCALHRHLSV
ncbi:type VI secretion system baseplate subunit TssF [Enterobacter mori]